MLNHVNTSPSPLTNCHTCQGAAWLYVASVYLCHADTTKNYFTGYGETVFNCISLAYKPETRRTQESKTRSKNCHHIQANHVCKSEMFIIKFQAIVSVLLH